MSRHIFVTGGVVSSLGKGLTSASIGMLLERRGLKVRMQKLDPYLNVDPGTMSPYQHGEVYVLDDGSETDLDLGHYERFTSGELNRAFELHDRPDLSVGDRKRTPRRISRPHRSGRSAHHRRNQSVHPEPGHSGCGCRHHGTRRHGRRHRRSAVSGSDPPDSARHRQRELPCSFT